MKKKNIVFKIFLIAYAALLVSHAIKLDWNLLSIISLSLGLILAYFAHSKKGFLTILLLAVHMSIEWSHHFEFISTYESGDFLLHGVHIVFDGVFLTSEWRRHSKHAFLAVLAGVSISLIFLFLLDLGSHQNKESQIASFPIEALVVGGILGCVGSHLLEKKKY